MPGASSSKPAHLPVAIGDVIAGKYEVERVIGAGGVGVVVAANHRGLDERVAIKLLQRSAVESAENVARFAREARAVARLKTEHVARIMDTGALPSGEPFMVMEYLDGHDLAERLRQKTKLPVREAVDYVVQACEAIALAHSLSIVHRDLKPANLFLTKSADGTPIIKVLDFGISKLLGDSSGDQAVTQTVSMIGSPLYMSPEQMERPKEADARADVWSIGVILYELISGKPPFEAPTLPSLCARICTAPPTPIEKHVQDVPAELTAVILSCLEKSPPKRPDVAALAAALAPFGLPRTAHAAKRIQRIAAREAIEEVDAPLAPIESDTSSVPRRLAWDSSPPPAATTAKHPRPVMLREPRPLSRALVGLAGLFLVATGALLFFGYWGRATNVGPVAPPHASSEAGASPAPTATAVVSVTASASAVSLETSAASPQSASVSAATDSASARPRVSAVVPATGRQTAASTQPIGTPTSAATGIATTAKPSSAPIKIDDVLTER